MRSILLGLLILSGAIDLAGAQTSFEVWQRHASAADPSFEVWQTLQNNAVTEAKAALERGDRRLVAVMAYSTALPGVDMEITEAERRFGFVVIEGTGDFYQTIWHRTFNERAREYAVEYNRYILEHASSPNP